jgi:ubiquinol-cytochrome c reductase cytochrome b subunit
MRFIKKYPIINLINSTLVDYPVPPNITYLWNFGVLAGICLVLQIVTGVFLAMFYIPNIDYAFDSVEYIMREVNYGWLIRYIHANGASFFFTRVYIHIFRGIYYNSYIKPRESLWCLGVVILIVMILTAFLGYVLPWGQMSF